MRVPGFTAEAAIAAHSGYLRMIGVIAAASSQREVELQQGTPTCCTYYSPCTGFWPWYQGTQCTQVTQGSDQYCVGGANQFAWIRECRRPSGAWETVGRGAGFCFWGGGGVQCN
jgi:hypothetical protein